MAVTSEPGLDRLTGRRVRIRKYGWLAAGAFALGASAVFGAGTAHADAGVNGLASGRAGTATGSVKQPVQHSVALGRGTYSAANRAGMGVAAKLQSQISLRGSVIAGPLSTAKAPTTMATTPCQTPTACGYASFSYTGTPQVWNVPTGVNSAYFEVIGGPGGPGAPPATGATAAGGLPVPLYATMQLAGGSRPAITELTIVVGGGGGIGGGGANNNGGYNGGGPGGSGSGSGWGGGGGGGATTIFQGGSPGRGIVLVGGGAGGGGGYRNGTGGTGGDGGQGPASNGAWAGGNGLAASGDNGGGGGAGSNQSSGTGAGGGEAEWFSGNGGGGGGGGGWRGGSGGQPGQASDDPFATAGSGGGGGGGSSYADPTLTTNVSVGTATKQDPGVVIQWVDILTATLAPMRAGRPTGQQLGAIYAGGWNNPVSWMVSGGTLPEGLNLSANGQLTGSPRLSGFYNFQVTVTSADGLADSVVTYVGTVYNRRIGRP